MPFPESTNIVEWKKYLSGQSFHPSKISRQNNEANEPDDPYGALRGMTSNEAQRSDVAKRIFGSSVSNKRLTLIRG
jgi:hypothetical protein